MITQPCPFGGPDHSYPDDWVFSSIGDPRADPRFEVVHYQYLDALAGFSFMSGQFICEDQALDYFSIVAVSDPGVKYIARKGQGDKKFTMLPFVYVVQTDTVHPYDWSANG